MLIFGYLEVGGRLNPWICQCTIILISLWKDETLDTDPGETLKTGLCGKTRKVVSLWKNEKS